MGEQYQYWNSRLVNGKLSEYVTDKKVSARTYINYMLIRLQKMFRYENLPDTLHREFIELYLMQSGSAFLTTVNDDLYVFQGTMGGEPDPYYRPTLYIVANPGLKLNKTYKLWGDDGILLRNDSLWLGLFPLMARYSTMLAENLVTLRVADIILRALSLLTAPDDATRTAGELYLKKLEKGELGVIGENRFFDGIKLQSPPSNNGSYLTQFIELQQYLKASFFNEIGLNANYNMKREAIMEGESNLNKDSLLPLCEEMLRCRQEDFKLVNDLYGTNIKVDFDSAWKQNLEEIELELNSQLAGEENGSAVYNKGSAEDNELSTVSSDGSDGHKPDGTDGLSVGDTRGCEGADSDVHEDDISRDRQVSDETVRDESGNEEVIPTGTDGNVIVNVVVNNGVDDDDK